ncbi:hypothetical protein NQ176_g10373 [Zarea fungicola]|uniref:Uncharacterized protein n=1 Tax=Zarea fungicola TaxID=93591 RepID=A0ACC1MGV3_9HYPO|nr:hypothetical protein NQ176_g10373 [Lecanicillium fungicola]
MAAKQFALGPTEDPVLLSSEVLAKQDHLSKVSMEVAMKGIRSFNSNTKKTQAKKPAAKGKGKKGGSVKFSGPDADMFGGDIDEEELERIIEDIRKNQAAEEERKKQAEGKTKTEEKEEPKKEDVHDEL